MERHISRSFLEKIEEINIVSGEGFRAAGDLLPLMRTASHEHLQLMIQRLTRSRSPEYSYLLLALVAEIPNEILESDIALRQYFEGIPFSKRSWANKIWHLKFVFCRCFSESCYGYIQSLLFQSQLIAEKGLPIDTEGMALLRQIKNLDFESRSWEAVADQFLLLVKKRPKLHVSDLVCELADSKSPQYSYVLLEIASRLPTPVLEGDDITRT